GPDAVEIRRWLQVFCWAVRLLRRDEPRCSEASQSSGEIGRCLERLGDPEIAHQRFAVLVQQNISRFQIAVQNAFTVYVLHGTTHFCNYTNAPARSMSKTCRGFQHSST